MKNFLKIGLFLTLAFIIASCENPTNEKPTLIDTTLEAITIKTNPTKTTYQVNEEFDPTGLVITATYTETYSNASTKTTTKDVTYNNGNMTFSGTDFSTAGTKTITVTYSEKGTTKTATLQVTVNQDGTPESGEDNSKIDTTLEAITIKTNPTKTTYQINEEFDPTGLVITATYTETYSNASTKTTTKDVTYNNGNMMFSGTDFSTAGTKTITVTYSENGTTKTATLQVTVNQDETPRTENVIITYAFVDNPDEYENDDEFILYCRSKATALLGDLSTATDVKINIPTGEVDTQFLYELYTEAKNQNNNVSVEFENPQNTTIGNYWWVTPAIDTTKDGDANKYASIKNFVELITPESQESPKLSVSLGFYCTDSVNGVNLYHTGIDKLLKKSCDLGRSDDIDMDGSMYFDAVDYLTEKGGIAYDQNNQYTGNYYDLDVNAALLMNGVAFKNVNIDGTLSKDITFGGSFTNTRFDVNSNGKVFEIGCDGNGLIEFAGDTPSVLPVTDKARLVISNADNENTIILEGGAVIDLTQLPDDGNVSFYNSGNVAYEHAYFKNEEAKQNYIQNGFGNNGTTYSLENGTSSIPYYATSQQWVDAANANDGEGNFVKTDFGVYMPNISNLQ